MLPKPNSMKGYCISSVLISEHYKLTAKKILDGSSETVRNQKKVKKLMMEKKKYTFCIWGLPKSPKIICKSSRLEVFRKKGACLQRYEKSDSGAGVFLWILRNFQ